MQTSLMNTGLLAMALMAGAAFSATAEANTQLSQNEIKQVVTGKRIYLKTPLGGEFPLHYRSNGKVDGSGDAVGLGRFMQPNDEGRWWVRGNRLCQKWQSWYDGKQFCFTLSKGEGSTLYWTRDDGKSGRARIGN
ncbi:hypothetical protein [Stappia sp. ES.058]|uniref:hypothetical protein n=1 Tax=Stappia sp. ES.058 TaxID=1881061 RepID=UPI00087C9249|nr:hypothetical protein [Stappia sp. ES.058]SDU09272.1 hypothetical protein SAMN05428979_1577 [Stappia sp. ES.058]